MIRTRANATCSDPEVTLSVELALEAGERLLKGLHSSLTGLLLRLILRRLQRFPDDLDLSLQGHHPIDQETNARVERELEGLLVDR